ARADPHSTVSAGRPQRRGGGRLSLPWTGRLRAGPGAVVLRAATSDGRTDGPVDRAPGRDRAVGRGRSLGDWKVLAAACWPVAGHGPGRVPGAGVTELAVPAVHSDRETSLRTGHPDRVPDRHRPEDRG